MFLTMRRVAPLLTAGLLAACAGTAAATHPHGEEDAKAAQNTKERIEWKVSGDKDPKQNKTIIVERDGDDSNVVIDGKRIEGNVSVVTKDGHLIISDGDGKVLRKIEMPDMPGNFAFRFSDDGGLRFSDDSNWQFSTDELNWEFSDEDTFEFSGGRPVIGVELDDSDGKFVIHRVLEDGPAAKAGLKAKDVILRINEHDAESLDKVRAVLEKHKAGDEVKVFVLRGDDKKEFKVRLAPADGDMAFAPEGGKFRVLFDEDRAEEMKERAWALQKRAEEQSRAHLREFRFDDEHANPRIAIELKEKLRHLDDDRRREIEAHLKRAESALKGLRELELHGDMPPMPEIEIFELDGKNNRFVVVPAPEAPRAPRAPRAQFAPRAPAPHAAQDPQVWGESNSRIERLEERVERIEALIEKIMHKLEERNG